MGIPASDICHLCCHAPVDCKCGTAERELACTVREKDDIILDLVRAAARAYLELNTIRARDGIPYKRDGYKSDVCPEYFSAVVDQLNDAVIRATGHSAHGHPELSVKEQEQ